MKKIIEEFLLERKNAKVKEKVKAGLLEDEKQKILDDLEEQFSLSVWLLDAAKRVSQLTMASHPSKFSHPDAKTSSIIAKGNKANDGYLRSGNVDYELDVFGNAAALDVYKFLTLKTEDGKTILDHLESNSAQAKEAFTIPNVNYEGLRQAFLSIKQSNNSNKTDRLVKQVYFPVAENSYHLLSILTPSGIVAKVKNQIDVIRFSEKSKEARECRRENKDYEGGFDDFFDLTVLSYGGTKPQNISILNSQNGGRSYLLPSLPPEIKKKDARLPTNDFFKNSLWAKSFRTNFEFLDRLIHKRKNADIRNQISETLTYIADQVLETVFKIRDFEKGWSNKENYQSLPLAQRIWLDDVNIEQRDQDENWFEEILASFTRWVIHTYEYLFKETCEKMGSAEFEQIKKIIKEAINLYPSKDCLIEHKKTKE